MKEIIALKLAKYTEHCNTSLLRIWDERKKFSNFRYCYFIFFIHPFKKSPFHKQNKYFRNPRAMKRTNFNCLYDPLLGNITLSICGFFVSAPSYSQTRLLSFGTIEVLIIRRETLYPKGNTMRRGQICKLCDRRYYVFF